MKFVLTVLIIVATAGSIFSQANSAANRTDISGHFLGTFSENKYRNEFFGFDLAVPSEMFVLTESEREAYGNAGKKLLTKDIVTRNRAALEKAASAEVLVFSVAEKSPGNEENASLNIGVLKQEKGVSSRMVANVSKGFFLKNPKFRLVRDTTESILSDLHVSVFELDFRSQEGAKPILMKYRVLIHQGYSITFVITYFDAKQLARFESLLDSVSFDPPQPKKADATKRVGKSE